MTNPVIAIDGYSSCGKSTVAKTLAQTLGLRYIDSGAMYRAVTLYFLQNNIPIPDAGADPTIDYKPVLDKINIIFQLNSDSMDSALFVNGTDNTEAIRSMEVSENVSHVSAIKEVRERMVELQQKMKKDGGLVMDGRDIGTTVFPDADLKIFMTADSQVRAERRYLELKKKGLKVSLEEVRSNIENRDYEDTHRDESPLRKAEDAIELDNTHMDYDEQVNFVLDQLKKPVTVTGEKRKD